MTVGEPARAGSCGVPRGAAAGGTEARLADVLEELREIAHGLHPAILANRGLGPADGVLHVRVRDDGRGGADFGHGSGLLGLRDRVEALGGRLWLRSPPGEGTTLQVQLPVGQARPWLLMQAQAPHTAHERCHRSGVLTDQHADQVPA